MAIEFSRTEMLPPLAPPLTERGAVKWMRENLFSSTLNIILTVLGVLTIFWLIKSSLPWWLNSVWNASSLSECRQIVTANAGEGATGACWAMVRQWWGAFIFGFYPPDQWWRPITALGLLVCALAPVLFAGQKRNLSIMIGGVAVFLIVTLTLSAAPGVAFALALLLVAGLLALAQVQPGKLLWFTLLFPALCFWLLWGGAVWSPIVAMAGFALLYAVFRLASPLIGLAPAAAAGIVAAVLWWLYLDETAVKLLQGVSPFALQSINSDQFGGFLLALVIGVTGITFSLPIGILLALGRQSDMLIVKSLSVGFIEFIRGVPLITLLFTASLLLQYFLPPGTNFDIILRVIILVTFFAAAYLAEVIRGGLASLPRGQYEASDALGLTYWQAQRLIIMPQALTMVIPGIVGNFISLLKDTSLVAIIGIFDLLNAVKAINSDAAWATPTKAVTSYICAALLFFVLCFAISRYSLFLEKRLRVGHKR